MAANLTGVGDPEADVVVSHNLVCRAGQDGKLLGADDGIVKAKGCVPDEPTKRWMLTDESLSGAMFVWHWNRKGSERFMQSQREWEISWRWIRP